MILETEHLLLKEMTAADHLELEKIFEHPNFFYAAALQDNITVEDAARRYAGWAEESRLQENRVSWFMSIYLKENLKFIGAVVLVDLFQHPEHESQIEIGYFINVNYQRKHYASEAAVEMHKFAIKELGVKSIYTTVDPLNIPSVRILEKIGLKMVKRDEISIYKTREGLPASRLHYRGFF